MPDLKAVGLSVRALEGASVTMGLPLHFQVEVRNSLPTDVRAFVTVSLQPPAPAAAIALAPWSGIVRATSTETFVRPFLPGHWYRELGAYIGRAQAAFLLQQAPTAGQIGSAAAEFAVQQVAPPGGLPRFADVTRDVGITTVLHTGDPCVDYAAGAAWGDIDGNGWPDLFIPQRQGPSELWLNDHGRFTESAATWGVRNGSPAEGFSVGIGAVFGDFDRDGRVDLFVANDGPDRLYRNEGGSFVDVSAAAGIAGDDDNHTSASWGDFDGDGWPDLFVTAHGKRSSCQERFRPGVNRLFRNQGDGTFADVTSILPRDDAGEGLGFQGTWVDTDLDGRLDLYLGVDSIEPSEARNVLWHNAGPDGNGRWRFAQERSGADVMINTMGVAVWDPSNSGRPGFVATNIGRIASLLNAGDGRYADRTTQQGLDLAELGKPAEGETTWGTGAADLNNDGRADLIVNAGPVGPSGPSPTRNRMYLGTDGERLLDVSAPSGMDDPGASRGLAFADFDRDGAMDVVVLNQGQAPHLWRNVTQNLGHWVGLRLRGRRSDTLGCGARVRASVGQMPPKTHWVFCGSVGEASGSDPMLHVGLGSQTAVARLDIDWPSGRHQTLVDVMGDRIVDIEEPE